MVAADVNVPENIATNRLVLRKPRLDDTARLHRSYMQDEEVVRYLTWRTHDSEAQTSDFLRRCLKDWASRENYPFVIALTSEALGPIGMIDLRPRPEGAQFAYVLARAHWGKGYMSEALTSLVEWSLGQPGIFRASAFCDAENLASARVMEKAGMDFEGVLRRYFVHPNMSPEPRDCRIYAKVRS